MKQILEVNYQSISKSLEELYKINKCVQWINEHGFQKVILRVSIADNVGFEVKSPVLARETHTVYIISSVCTILLQKELLSKIVL